MRMRTGYSTRRATTPSAMLPKTAAADKLRYPHSARGARRRAAAEEFVSPLSGLLSFGDRQGAVQHVLARGGALDYRIFVHVLVIGRRVRMEDRHIQTPRRRVHRRILRPGDLAILAECPVQIFLDRVRMRRILQHA